VKTVYIFKTISHKNRDVVILPLTSPNVNRFSKFIHSKIDFSRKFAIISYLKYIVIPINHKVLCLRSDGIFNYDCYQFTVE